MGLFTPSKVEVTGSTRIKFSSRSTIKGLITKTNHLYSSKPNQVFGFEERGSGTDPRGR